MCSNQSRSHPQQAQRTCITLRKATEVALCCSSDALSGQWTKAAMVWREKHSHQSSWQYPLVSTVQQSARPVQPSSLLFIRLRQQVLAIIAVPQAALITFRYRLQITQPFLLRPTERQARACRRKSRGALPHIHPWKSFCSMSRRQKDRAVQYKHARMQCCPCLIRLATLELPVHWRKRLAVHLALPCPSALLS